MTVDQSLLLLWFLPLLAALVGVLLPQRHAGLFHWVAAALMGAATLLAGSLAWTVVFEQTPIEGVHTTWLDVGSFSLGVGVYLDAMGAIMAVIVCLLATLVLVFNHWYMHDDPLAARFPWQFCGFVFAMLGVVLSDNLFLSFCCWELVGLGSYLLIGFWWHKPPASEDPEYQAKKGRDARGVLESVLSPSHAQLKAFVMNRFGDAGFLIGIGTLLTLQLHAGVEGDLLGFRQLDAAVAASTNADLLFLGLSGGDLVVLAALGVFAGAVGKSAQFPLHGWLPDAMQGPTTASSIIHAATMVAAGVFLVARAYPLFTPDALTVVSWVGGVTCLLAASIACVQWDLKAVLAYSTVSQLGLMFVALGAGEAAGGRAAGIAHLFTHAMFKCLLFLCAGAIIHACNGHQDLHRMGGLKKRMPIVAWASLAAVLAIAGAPLFSGFYSKDGVLGAALASALANGGGAWGPFVLACAGSLLTSAYMGRWWLQIFFGRERESEVTHHAHDPGGSANVALLVLVPFTLALPWTLGGWLDHALGAAHGGEVVERAHSMAMALALGLLALGASCAFALYAYPKAVAGDWAGILAQRLAGLHRACAELWGIDRLWHRVFARGLGAGGASMAARIDLGSPERLGSLDADSAARDSMISLDGLVDSVGEYCLTLGEGGARAHGGRLGVYLATAVVLCALGAWWGLS